ncbi:glycosyl hydrolase family 18 protein [Butyrivibrio proteoclasticus]|uniref:glycosyl hydrolase family 18 protein n=1 Tax=Butyrivibrio proteoclasticus TaxID=43305 RepID=UPI00047D95FB|nr:glycosyl hydrolase family 18 protein [Butyrivibrio proteoclasticus]
MKKKVIPAIIIIALIFIIGGIYGYDLYKQHFSYTSERVDLDSYFDITSDSDVAIILGDERIEERALLLDGFYYMDFASVQKYLNARFYNGENDNTLIYTTASKIITADVDTGNWYDTDGGSGTEQYVIARRVDDVLYVALDYVKKYTNFSYEGFTDHNHLQLTTSWEDRDVATVKKDTKLRIRGGVKSEILVDLNKGDKVVVLETMENWSKVKSPDSYIGYVENKRLSEVKSESPIPVTDYVEEEYTSISRDHKINLGFHNVASAAGNDTFASYVDGAKSLNVISPTWLTIASNEGDVRSFAQTSYVNAAHDRGIEVWVLVDNFTGPDDVSTSEVISHAASRAKLIEGIISETTGCGADGVNLDFEMIATSDGQSYIEFVRELSIACRKNGLVFSIDNYVPMNFNDHYDLKEQGIVADYVIIMGYDEHYGGSDEAGSVASLSYVENGIINALEDVDASKVINAVPFYTRIWHTSNGSVSSEAVSMKTQQEYIANHGIELTWDAEAGQYYGEFTSSDGTLNQVWVEDAESISQKITSMQYHNIAGIAAWSLGMETSDIWDVIAAYVEG